tara:strand:+ start:86 stop:625 length:540 start_codon:yes stop_codon:yes gene_type:complete
MKLEVNIEKKYAFMIGAAILIFAGVMAVYAFSPTAVGGNPEVFGHSSGEIRVDSNNDGNIDLNDKTLQEYIDDVGLGGGMAFGDWVDVTSQAIDPRTSVQGPAATDGFVLAKGSGTNHASLFGYTDGNNPPTTERVHHSDLYGYSSPNALDEGLMMPVKKGDYWKVTGANDYVYWMPVG